MIQFILAIPGTVLYGCIGLIVFALAVSIVLVWQTWFAGSQISALANAIQAATKGNPALNRDGPPLGTLELIRGRCERLKGLPRGWWNVVDSHVEQYTSTEEVEGWFLTEKPRQILAYEITVSKHFHSACSWPVCGLPSGSRLWQIASEGALANASRFQAHPALENSGVWPIGQEQLQ